MYYTIVLWERSECENQVIFYWILQKIVESELENEVDSGIEELFQDETNIGTKEEFTSEVKSEFEPVSSDKSDNVQIVDKKLQELNPEMIEARKCRQECKRGESVKEDCQRYTEGYTCKERV